MKIRIALTATTDTENTHIEAQAGSDELWFVTGVSICWFGDDHEQKEGEGKTILPNVGRFHFANRISWCKKDGSYIYSNIHRDHKRLYRAITISAIWSDTASTRTHLGCLRLAAARWNFNSILFFFPSISSSHPILFPSSFPDRRAISSKPRFS